MKVTRIITYEGSEERLDSQLGQSLPDGVREYGSLTITVTTLPSGWGLWRLLRALWGR